jgi:hypothetical protein
MPFQATATKRSPQLPIGVHAAQEPNQRDAEWFAANPHRRVRCRPMTKQEINDNEHYNRNDPKESTCIIVTARCRHCDGQYNMVYRGPPWMVEPWFFLDEYDLSEVLRRFFGDDVCDFFLHVAATPPANVDIGF